MSVASPAYVFTTAQAAGAIAVLSARLDPVPRLDFAIYRLILIALALPSPARWFAGLEYTRSARRWRRRRQRTHGGGIGIDVDRASPPPSRSLRTRGLGGALAIEIVGLDPCLAFTYLVYVLIVVSVGGLARSPAPSPPPLCSASATSPANITCRRSARS